MQFCFKLYNNNNNDNNPLRGTTTYLRVIKGGLSIDNFQCTIKRLITSYNT